MNKLLILTLLAISYQSASAQLVTESFGSGANAFTMDFVTIGNPGNAADTTGAPNPAGSVAYVYNMGIYEVRREMIDKANLSEALGVTMENMANNNYGGNGANRPATGINWREAAKFVNYLNISTGGVAAYKIVGGSFQIWSSGDAGYNSNNQYRNSLAKYFLPSTDEWYKAAYYDQNKTGGPGYWNYPTASDNAPMGIVTGTWENSAVYGGVNGPADVTEAGSFSSYGTMGQGGNAWELMETAFDGINSLSNEARDVRGGAWNYVNTTFGLDASSRLPYGLTPDIEPFNLGFRVAMIPEPSSLSLLALGGVAVALRRRR